MRDPEMKKSIHSGKKKMHRSKQSYRFDFDDSGQGVEPAWSVGVSVGLLPRANAVV